LSLEAKLDLYDMLQRYSHYGWTKQAICRKWGISIQTFRSLKKSAPKTDRPRGTPLNTITDDEKQEVKRYAFSHPGLNHREMAYRMIDEDVAFLSPSSVYRILFEFNLLRRRGPANQHEKWHPHARLSSRDEVWQTDLMNARYKSRDYYSLSYFDAYSRYVVYNEVCLSMTGDSIEQASLRAIQVVGKKPKAIQSDNGSCYISIEYRNFIAKSGIEHRRIHPHCPNENAEIERFHRTLRELADFEGASDFEAFEKIIKEQIYYYNHVRYHSGIGYVTPYDMYTGKAEAIQKSRKQKLEQAKERRLQVNLNRLQTENQLKSQQAA
jgi:putative transposase